MENVGYGARALGRAPAFGVVEQPLAKFARGHGGFKRMLQGIVDGRTGFRSRHRDFQVAANRGERVVKIVNDAFGDVGDGIRFVEFERVTLWNDVV